MYTVFTLFVIFTGRTSHIIDSLLDTSFQLSFIILPFIKCLIINKKSIASIANIMITVVILVMPVKYIIPAVKMAANHIDIKSSVHTIISDISNMIQIDNT